MALSSEEIDKFYARVKPNALLAGAIVKVYLSSPDPSKKYQAPEHGSFLHAFPSLSSHAWTDSGLFGALLLVMDPSTNAVTFEIWNMKTMNICFAYELYLDFTSDRLSPDFYAFEIDDCVMGFSFSDKREATSFFNKVETVTSATHNIVGSKKKFFGASPKIQKNSSKQGSKVSQIGSQNESQIGLSQVGRKASRNNGSFFQFWKKKDKSPEFSMPFAVQKNVNIALKADGTFDIANMPLEWKKTFKEAGIRKKDLRNPNTASTIFSALQTQEMLMTYKEQPEYANMHDKELEKFLSAQQDEYDQYLSQYKDYEYEKSAYDQYNRQVSSLTKWENDVGVLKTSPPAVPKKIRKNGSRNGGGKSPKPRSPGHGQRSPKPKARPNSPARGKNHKPSSPTLPPLPTFDLENDDFPPPPPDPDFPEFMLPTQAPPLPKLPSIKKAAPKKPTFKSDMGKVKKGLRLPTERISAQTTLKRLHKKVSSNTGAHTTLVSKLQQAIQARRDLLDQDDGYDSDDSDWSM